MSPSTKRNDRLVGDGLARLVPERAHDRALGGAVVCGDVAVPGGVDDREVGADRRDLGCCRPRSGRPCRPSGVPCRARHECRPDGTVRPVRTARRWRSARSRGCPEARKVGGSGGASSSGALRSTENDHVTLPPSLLTVAVYVPSASAVRGITITALSPSRIARAVASTTGLALVEYTGRIGPSGPVSVVVAEVTSFGIIAISGQSGSAAPAAHRHRIRELGDEAVQGHGRSVAREHGR